jgi:signal transduction histidine kinase
VSLLAVHAGALEVRREASADERAGAGVIRQCAHDVLEDLRSLLGMLRAPAEDRPQPTLGDVPALLEQSRSAGADVGLSMPADEDVLDEVPDQTGRHAYRILQEALTNARKHSPGAPVRVEVDIAYRSGITLRVDNPLAAPAFDLRWLAAAAAAAAATAATTTAARGPVTAGSAIPGAGAGLVGLRERVELVGGRLAHGPTAAGEFNLEAWLPWQT